MGINIELQDENGDVLERIVDEKHLLRHLLPSMNRSLLSGIDPYGDTVFNRIQMDDLLTEIDGLKTKQMSSEQFLHLANIERLAQNCKRGVHLYLKFIGD